MRLKTLFHLESLVVMQPILWKGRRCEGGAALFIWVWLPLLVLLTVAVITDLRRRLIYDWLTLPGLLYFVGIHLFLGDLGVTQTLGGALGLGGICLLIAMASKGQLGGGDIKLFAMIGAALGFTLGVQALMLTFILAACIAWPVLLLQKLKKSGAKRVDHLPMAPFIAVSTLILIGL
ncbi:prepilin peptidase [Paenibacillus sp. N10]|uniref:Prepilin peptidase n=1 Tax=Paenibacillus lutrae TaxID=2078573 RepID=A0A7X3FKU8_9BACL|nr:prepilin peptidase [Paenibacillus lutrae]